MESDSSHHEDDDTEILQFNLTNHDKLTKQLDEAHLDENETDALLKEALRINAQLKETLRLQQLEEANEVEASGGRRRQQSHGNSEPPAPRKPKPSILPPIGQSNINIYDSRTKSRESKSKGQRNPNRTGSASKQKGTGTPERRVKRPPWDDRFSFG